MNKSLLCSFFSAHNDNLFNKLLVHLREYRTESTEHTHNDNRFSDFNLWYLFKSLFADSFILSPHSCMLELSYCSVSAYFLTFKSRAICLLL